MKPIDSISQRLLLPTMLLALLQGCSTALPQPVVVRPPPLPALPIQARQPAPPTMCAISCSLGLSTLLDSLRMVSELKRNYPPQAIQSYVISETRTAGDVLSLAWLAELNGVQVAALTSPAGIDPGVMPPISA